MNIRVRTLSEAEWLATSAGFRDAAFEQSVGYGRPAAARIGGQLRLLAIEADGATLALAAARIRHVPGFRRGIAWVPGGPLIWRAGGFGPGADTLRAILGALRDQLVGREGHVLRLRLPAIMPPGVDGAVVLRDAGFGPTSRAPRYRSFAMDLSRDAEQLMASLHGKWRTDLRFALKSGMAVDQGSSRDGPLAPTFIARFMSLYRTVQDAKGFRPDITPEFHFACVGDAASPDYTLDILIATKDGEDLAGIVIGTTGMGTTYLFGATGDAGRPLRAGYLLQWEGMALARGRGGAWYDLGGVDFDENPDVARFKERMGGQAVATDAYEARPSGVFPHFVEGLERLRAEIRKRRK
jgi:hypothetical protein